MRRVLAISILILLAIAISPGKPPAKATSASVNAGQSEAKSNADLNIEAYVQLLRTEIRKSKSQMMGEVMQLDTDQAAKFWPIYKEFEAGYSEVGDKIVGLVKNYCENYDKMTDALADQLATQLLGIEQERNELKKKYYDRMKSALGAITAARFLQVENQLERVSDLQVAAQLPVVGEQ